MFDVDNFVEMQFTGANDTNYIPIPEIEDAVATTLEVKGRELDDGRVVIDVVWDITDPRVEEVTGRSKNICRQSIFLDLTPSGGLDMGKGKNVALGRLRSALGLNNPDRRFSIQEVVGKTARVQTKHSASQDPDNPYVNVVAVRPL